MKRVAAFLQTHTFVLAIDLVIVVFLWVLLVLQQAVTVISRPPNSLSDIIETPISPLNTRTFDRLKTSLSAESSIPNLDWSRFRDPFGS